MQDGLHNNDKATMTIEEGEYKDAQSGVIHQPSMSVQEISTLSDPCMFFKVNC